MSRNARPHYRPGLGWILGVAFEDTLTRPVRLAQGFTFVRCHGSPRASSPHGLTAPGLASLDGITACSCLWLAVATNAPREGLSPPIQCPCQAHLRRWPSAIIDPARTARPRGKQAGTKGWPVAQPNQGMAGPFRRIWPSIPCCLWRWRSPPSAASACRRRSPLSETCPSFCPRTV